MGTAAQEVVREVGISHCNNSKSLIDHVHSFDTTHYVLDTLQKEVLSFLWDLGYYLTKKERDEICQVLDDVQYACHDMHFNETVNNYHRHHFDINKQTEAKGLRSWATDGIGITHMYKQLVMESKRQETKQIEEYINQLVHNFIHEITQHAQKLKDIFEACRSRVNAYNPMCTPVMSVEFEDYEAKKEIQERRGDPTWLKTHGDRPHHSLGLPRPQRPLPTGDQTSFQGGRNLYESFFNERKSALNQPKYAYKIQGLQDQTQAKVRAEAARRLELPQRR